MSEVGTSRADGERDEGDGPGRLKRLHRRLHANKVTGLITKIVVSIVGAAVVLAGVVLSGPGIPGPGIVVIILGLAILATEWEWADRLVKWARDKAKAATDKARQMDPAVRRRRIALGLLALLVLVGIAAAYVYFYDWPSLAVNTWDRIQDVSSAVPELPGM